MGNWNITIQGVGAHGNRLKGDAEQLYKKFVEEMKQAGHSIVHSSITSGGAYFSVNEIPPVLNREAAKDDKAAESIAMLCHEVNRAYCRSIGDDSQPAWNVAPDWQKQSAINGVKFHLENETTPEMSHESWMAEKLAAGWTYGSVKDPDKKTHPCMVPYDQLPVEQRTKDYLFKAIVDSYK